MHALILGATGGIGRALADHYGARGGAVTGLSRRDGLDWRDPARAEACLAALDGSFTHVICATGALCGAGRAPEKSLSALDADALADQFAVNAIGPALFLKHLPRLLRRDRPTAAAVLTARVGSISDNQLGGWYSYRASKAAANQLVRTAAIELARSHPQAALIAYHPGTVATSFTANYNAPKHAPPEAAAHLLQVLDGLSPVQTGRFYDWQGIEVGW